MKTHDQVEQLKREWLEDPCWDIEDTEGFEEYRDELFSYRKDKELEWMKARELKFAGYAKKYCPLSFASEESVHCHVDKCAWWNEVEERCAVRVQNMR